MASVTGAPKVIFKEQDLSFFVANVTVGRYCMQLTSRRGPVNQPVLIGSMKQFRETYGIPIASSDSDLVVQRALDRGAVLYLNRVTHYTDPSQANTKTSAKSSLTIDNAAGNDTLTVEAESDGIWGNNLLVKINVSPVDPQRFDLSVIFPEQPEMNEVFTALTMNNFDERYAVTFVNEQSKLIRLIDLNSGNPFDGDEITVDNKTWTIGTDFPPDAENLENMAAALANLINTDLATVTATHLNNVVTVTAVTPGTGGNSLALAVVSNGDNILLSGASLAGGAAAVAATGSVTYGVPANGDTITVAGTLFTKVAAAPGPNEFTNITELTALIDALASVSATDNGAVISIVAATPGVAGNAITLAKTGSALTLSGATLAGGTNAVAATGTITFKTNFAVIDNPIAISATALAGGDDGLSGLDSDDWIGSSIAGTGFHAFSDIDDAWGLGTPEDASPEVVAAGIFYCETRGDMVYYCEPGPTVLDAAEALEFRNGTGSYSHSAFNSSFGAMYFGRPKIRSPKTNNIVSISTIGDVFGVHAFSDSRAEAWFAPAGLQRGLVPNTLGVHYNVGTPAREAERDSLSDNQINPIVDLTETGTVIWDARTLQRLPSALQSLNIRRLLIYMRKSLSKLMQIFLFEPNDPTTWRKVYALLDPWMSDLLQRRAFYEYQIQCDQDARTIDEAILNTPERIDRGEFVCRIFFKPTRMLRYFMIEAVITKSSANFTELINIQSL